MALLDWYKLVETICKVERGTTLKYDQGPQLHNVFLSHNPGQLETTGLIFNNTLYKLTMFLIENLNLKSSFKKIEKSEKMK